MSDYVAVLAIVVAIISLVLAIYADKKSRSALAHVIWLSKEYGKLIKLGKETLEIVESKPVVTLHTIHEVPAEKKDALEAD